MSPKIIVGGKEEGAQEVPEARHTITISLLHVDRAIEVEVVEFDEEGRGYVVDSIEYDYNEQDMEEAFYQARLMAREIMKGRMP